MKKYTAAEVEELHAIARSILEETKDARIFALYGPMGVGKTTLIKEFLKSLGVEDRGSSPTFSLVNEYKTHQGEKVYHFDFYRVSDPEEIYDMGYEEYFFSNHYCFVEWPEKMETLLPDEAVGLRLKVEGGKRVIELITPN
jgi:tRNA threonylcarbamoyladenosine biosynthesis protein TsaE